MNLKIDKTWRGNLLKDYVLTGKYLFELRLDLNGGSLGLE